MMASDLSSKAIAAITNKDYESAISYYGEICEIEERKGFNAENVKYLIEYANALFKNAIQKNDIFDKQQQKLLQSSDAFKEKYTLLDVEDEGVDDFEAAFDILERAKQISKDSNAGHDILAKIEQLLADICFEDSNFKVFIFNLASIGILFELLRNISTG
eukprot:NODE_173_length_15916_cov_0.397673.p7 type:complete len:160 gc:universal NODE_173_length_15916_cov_0.397673:9630-10109(+)